MCRVGGVSHDAAMSVHRLMYMFMVLNAGDHLHSCAVDVKRRGSGSAVLPKVHYHLFCFVVVESEVVLPAPQSQNIHLLPVC